MRFRARGRQGGVEVARQGSCTARRGAWFGVAIIIGLTAVTGTALAAPANDIFRKATAVDAVPFGATGDTTAATLERGEPLDCFGESGSIWFKYTAAESGTLTADTFGSGYDTVLGVYTGRRVNALTLVDCNDDAQDLQSQVVFEATAGETYDFRVSGFSNGSSGNVTFNLYQGPPPPPCFDLIVICLPL